MAQAFVRKVFKEKKTQSTIQVPDEPSCLDEENVKEVLEKCAQEFFDSNAEASTPDLETVPHRLASHANKILIRDCSSAKDHKIVVNVVMTENWGQGVKVFGRCLWNSKCDRVVSVNKIVGNQICVVSAYFSKIPDESSDEEFSDNDDDLF